MKLLLAALVLSVSATGALAQACTREIREDFAAATARTLQWRANGEEKWNMGRARWTRAEMCDYARFAPRVLQIAQRYYPACDPHSAGRNLAFFERHARDAAVAFARYCTAGRP